MPSTFRFRASLRPPLLSVDDYRRAAERVLPRPAWAYVDGGASGQETVAENRTAFSRWQLRSRVLCGAQTRELGVKVAGTALSMPVILAPTGLSGLVHFAGELGAAQAAERSGTRLVLSNAASYSVEEVAAGTSEDHWFQLYPYYDHAFMAGVMDRAAAAGFGALFVTLDVPTYGNREHEIRNGMDVPPVLTVPRVLDAARKPRWAYGLLRHRRVLMPNFGDKGGGLRGAVNGARNMHDRLSPDLDWDDLAFIRSHWKGPLFAKGVLDPDDAARCIDLGLDGVVVSNHGGRQLDSSQPALDALAPVSEAIGGRAQVLFDGGIRRGSDVIKAIALGADACLIGKSFLYGLAVGGRQGVTEVLSILREEMDRDLCLMGLQNIAQVDRSWIIPAAT